MPQNQTVSIPVNSPHLDGKAVDTEFIILENIYNTTEPLRQRDLAHITGASLGMTNSILKRLAQKGLISIKKLNSRNIQYAITLEGINEIIHRSYRYFKRTIQNVVFFKEILEELLLRVKNKGINTVILAGKSDLDFIVEYACRRWSMQFSRKPYEEMKGKTPADGFFIIYSESISDSTAINTIKSELKESSSRLNTYYLSRLIIRQAVSSGISQLEK